MKHHRFIVRTPLGTVFFFVGTFQTARRLHDETGLRFRVVPS